MASDSFRNARGTRDLYPDDLLLIHHLERTAIAVAQAAAYREIRTPLFEETRLFKRSLGEATDVVEKEMFTVPRRTAEGAEPSSTSDPLSFTFRPEGTASVVRAYVQGGYAARAPLQKWYYVGPMFRYERPQKGRERQFTQFGVEAFGAQSATLDAEVIGIALDFFQRLGFGDQLEVRMNSMGDPQDRELWRDKLREFFAPQFEGDDIERCADCRDRFTRNILRLLDCKVPRCQELNAGAPDLFDVMNQDALTHHQQVGEALRAIGFEPKEDRSIVRGLDYYSRTVFEVHYPPLGARSALCGGGRYDGLVEEMGGRPTPGVGFSVGFTPTELALAELGLPPAQDMDDLRAQSAPQVFAIAVSAEDRLPLFAIVEELRKAGVRCELDHRGKSPKAQFKEAAKSQARFALVLGPDERVAGQVVLRDLQQKEERKVAAVELAATITQALSAT
ncbi:MAG: histidine--tRNA ligase [Planctomycetes bacterium]|nr:histidine--tRNA ligase [Planctomycetota bacterium]MCP4771695.1 histidine--tRNA ligase [Planctomycetota bacterium]MCP4860005.1 histidine--tRNA ligase [Planctomycetota bacterium]